MSQPTVGERRKHRRIKLDGHSATLIGANRQNCRLTDISPVGAGAKVSVPLQEMSLVALDIALGGGRLPKVEFQCQAAVVRAQMADDGTCDVGLFFLDLDENAKKSIERFIEAAEKSTDSSR